MKTRRNIENNLKGYYTMTFKAMIKNCQIKTGSLSNKVFCDKWLFIDGITNKEFIISDQIVPKLYAIETRNYLYLIPQQPNYVDPSKEFSKAINDFNGFIYENRNIIDQKLSLLMSILKHMI